MNPKPVFSLPSLAAGPQSFCCCFCCPLSTPHGLCLLSTSSFVLSFSLSSLPHQVFLQPSCLYLPPLAGACRYTRPMQPQPQNPSSLSSLLFLSVFPLLCLFALLFFAAAKGGAKKEGGRVRKRRRRTLSRRRGRLGWRGRNRRGMEKQT